MLFEDHKQCLVIVYHNKLLRDLALKFTDTIEWGEEDAPDIIDWDEKTWRDNSRAGNIQNKVLLIGDLKDTRSLTKILDRQFEKHGILFGWSGKKAVLIANKKALSSSRALLAFFEEYQTICPQGYFEPQSDFALTDTNEAKQGAVSEQPSVVQNEAPIVEQHPASEQTETPAEEKPLARFRKGFLDKIVNTQHTIKGKYELFKDKRKLNDYQYYFGIVKICSDPNLLQAFWEK